MLVMDLPKCIELHGREIVVACVRSDRDGDDGWRELAVLAFGLAEIRRPANGRPYVELLGGGAIGKALDRGARIVGRQ